MVVNVDITCVVKKDANKGHPYGHSFKFYGEDKICLNPIFLLLGPLVLLGGS